MKTKIRYKTLPEDKCPRGFQYRKGVWYKEENFKGLCNVGFHCSKNVIDAMSYVTPGWVAKVEVRGASAIENDKEAWSEIRIVEWKKMTKKDSAAFAIYAAELVLKNYEKKYPDDMRPREAIEAAKAVLKRDTKKNRSAAYAAYSAAGSAERSAARSAHSAAYSARSAAYSAASAAHSSAYSARSAAYSAASAASAASAHSAAYSARSAAYSAASAAHSSAYSARSAAYSAASAASAASAHSAHSARSAHSAASKKCHKFLINRLDLK